MTREEAESLSSVRTFCRIETYARGIAVILTRVAPGTGGLWQEEVVSYDLDEAKAIVAASEAAIAAGLKSRSVRMRTCAEALDQKLAQFMTWAAERRAEPALAA